MAYTKTNWVAKMTPLSAANFNHMEEGIADVSKLLEYSASEEVIGTWVDGKPLYRKVITIGNLPNNGSKYVNHGISNVSFKSIRGYATNNTTFMPLPFAHTTSANAIVIYATATQIVLQTGLDRSSYSAVAIVEYTKTTD